MSNRIGKMIAAKIPILRLLENVSDTSPTSVGPLIHPMSPAKAKRANIAVPPAGILLAAILNVPGQRIPTDKPHNAQPIKPTAGNGLKAVNK